MKERPILFNAEMVNAILKGRKTQTRRVAKYIPDWDHYGKKILDWGLSVHPHQHFDEIYGKRSNLKDGDWTYDIQTDVDDSKCVIIKCPFGKVGDHLWVRETFCIGTVEEEDPYEGYPRPLYVHQDGSSTQYSIPREWCLSNNISIEGVRWKPSIHMPRHASRILLEITNIRVERLQDISEEDCLREGVGSPILRDCKKPKFMQLWESINGENSWDIDPWVWVISFRVLKGGAA